MEQKISRHWCFREQLSWRGSKWKLVLYLHSFSSGQGWWQGNVGHHLCNFPMECKYIETETTLKSEIDKIGYDQGIKSVFNLLHKLVKVYLDGQSWVRLIISGIKNTRRFVI